MRHPLLILLLLLLAPSALAQGLEVQPPPDRFANPGEFVTLVFRVDVPEAGTLELRADTPAGWTRVSGLEPRPASAGVERIAVTVGVPSDAAALSAGAVSLHAAVGPLEGSATAFVTVTEQRTAALAAPSEVALEGGSFTVEVHASGNGRIDGTLRLVRDERELSVREVALAPGERRAYAFEVEEAGLHRVRLEAAGLPDEAATVRVVSTRPPAASPFTVAGELRARLDADGDWRGELALQGPLSDYARLDLRAHADAPERSHADVRTGRWGVRLGATGSDPFGLGLDAGPGAAGRYAHEDLAATAAVGRASGGGVAFYAAGAFGGGSALVAAGAGLDEGRPQAALRAATGWNESSAQLHARLRDDRLGAGIALRNDDFPGTATAGLEAAGIPGERGSLRLSVAYDRTPLSLWLRGVAPLGEETEPSWLLGGRRRIADGPAGRFAVQLEAGWPDAATRLTHELAVGGWRAGSAAGFELDDGDPAVVLSHGWRRSQPFLAILNGSLRYEPAGDGLDGGLDLRAQAPVGLHTLYGSARWDGGDELIAVAAGGVIEPGRWSLDLSGGASYRYDEAEWELDLALEGRYRFDLPVPAGVTRALGGHRAGTVRGRVRTDAEPLPGVGVRVGPYRAETDEAGAFEMRVPPGRDRLELDTRTLPLTVRPAGPTSQQVEVPERGEAEAVFDLVRSAALSGRILRDDDGDGVADEPAAPVAAAVELIDASGARQRLEAPDGRFEAAGLAPGPASVRLLDLPLGSRATGPDGASRLVDLRAGAREEVGFTVRPVAAQARSFDGGDLRLRSVEIEVERTPPGTAPRVTVAVRGDASAVALRLGDRTLPLRRDGGSWTGRVPVPADAAPGVLAFEVRAEGRDGAAPATRRTRLVVDPAAPALELSARAAARPGDALTVELLPRFEASAATARLEGLGGEVALEPGADGVWRGTLTVPADAAAGFYELRVEAVPVGGGEGFEARQDVRVVVE